MHRGMLLDVNVEWFIVYDMTKLINNNNVYLINPLSISTITRAIMSKMNGKYIIKESTAVAVQYFLIHQALGLGSGAV